MASPKVSALQTVTARTNADADVAMKTQAGAGGIPGIRPTIGRMGAPAGNIVIQIGTIMEPHAMRRRGTEDRMPRTTFGQTGLRISTAGSPARTQTNIKILEYATGTAVRLRRLMTKLSWLVAALMHAPLTPELVGPRSQT